MSPSITELSPTRGQQRVRLVPEAVERQIVSDGRRRLSKRALRETKTAQAIEKMPSPSLGAFERAVEIIQSGEEEDRDILAQFTEVGVINQIVIPATQKKLEELSASATDSYRTRTSSPELETLFSSQFTDFLRNNFSSPEDQEIAITAIRAIRGHAIIGDDILRQLLWRIQFSGMLTFDRLGRIFGQAGWDLQQESPNLARELIRAKNFISAASEGIKRTRGIETPEKVMRRSHFLSQAMALLAQEHIEKHGNTKQATTSVARALVRSFFTHHLHYVRPKDQVLNLCSELSNPAIKLDSPPDLKAVIAQVLLEAQLMGLIDPASERSSSEAIKADDYLLVGLDFKTFRDHRELTKKRKAVYVEEDLLDHIPPGTNVMTILGFYSLSHLGYLALVGGTRFAINRFPPRENGHPWQIVVSVNERDLLREKRALGKNELPAFPLETRVGLLLENLAGVSGEDVIITSIEKVVSPEDRQAFSRRITAFTKKIKGLNGGIVARSSGYDRRDVAPPELNPLFLSLRGADLRKILRNPAQLEELKAALPETQIHLILLSGSTRCSSTRVWNEARDWLTKGSKRALHSLMVMTHRRVTPGILRLVREELEKRGEKIVVNL
jgi:hypothetical protein